MTNSIFIVDAFANEQFTGNPAAVCPLKEWLPDAVMQKIAAENNQAETAFFVERGSIFEIRWFTPTVEVDLCGHATLAAAHVLFKHMKYTSDTLSFFSLRSGNLKVTKLADQLILDFPSDIYQEVSLTEELTDCFTIKPVEAYKGKTDYMLVFETEAEISQIKVDLNKIAQLKARGVIITAKGEEVDFVSRFFAPQSGINEDPVTGSAHTTLTPYWATKLKKTNLAAIQLSERKGYLQCKYFGDRVEISGKAITYLQGEIVAM